VSLDFEGRTLDLCSGAVVSDQGHILTVGHCLEACLRLGGSECPFKLNGEDVTLKVLATNDCSLLQWLTPGNTCAGMDFALVQPSRPAAGSCLRVSAEPPAAGRPLLSLSYPVKSYRSAYRTRARDSDGAAEFASFGTVIPRSPVCINKIDTRSTELPKTPYVKLLLEKTDVGQLVQTTVDILKQSSGGPLLDVRSGEVVAIASTFAQNNSNLVECEGSTFFMPVSRVFEDIRTRYPQLDWNALTHCERHAIYGSVSK
jgi:hypothetical protein